MAKQPITQEYALEKKEDPELNAILVKAAKEDTWKKIKSPLLILLMAAGIFIFLTQQDVYQKIYGLLATLTTLLPLLGGLFNKPTGKTDGV